MALPWYFHGEILWQYATEYHDNATDITTFVVMFTSLFLLLVPLIEKCAFFADQYL